jgi:hypothetical protein
MSAAPFTAEVRCHASQLQPAMRKSARISAIEVEALG